MTETGTGGRIARWSLEESMRTDGSGGRAAGSITRVQQALYEAPGRKGQVLRRLLGQDSPG